MVDAAAFTPAGDTVSLAVTGTTGRVALTQKPGTPSELTVVVFNAGAQTVFVNFGTVAVTAATTTSMPIPAGATVEFQVNATQTHIAAITGSSTATIYATSGAGSLKAYGVGGGIGGSGEVITGATTPSDNFANPTTAVTTFSLGALWDGATWDRWPGNSAGGGTVNLATAAGTAIVATTTNLATADNVLGVTLKSGAPIAPATATATRSQVIGAQYNATLPTFTDGQQGSAQVGTRGSLHVELWGTDAATPVIVGTAADGATLTGALRVQSINTTYNGTTADLMRSVANSTNSTGTGIAAMGLLAQLDDTSPSSVTENQFANLRMNAARVLYVSQQITTCSATITRPNDSNAYAANDAFANSTSAPTSGGFTFTSAAQWSGGTGIITSAVISASAGTAYQGEIWIFDQAVTATNDNSALSVADSDVLFLVGIIPFNTTDVTAVNSVSYVTGLNIGFTCVGTANLRFLVKIMAAVTPAAQEVLGVRIQIQN